MHGAVRGHRIVGRRDSLTLIAVAVVGAVVLSPEASYAVFQLGGECIVGAIHRAERGVAAGRGHFERIEHARLGRHVEIRHVCVPHRFAVAQAADWLAVHFDVGDDVDFWQPLNETATGLLNRRPVEVT